MYEYIYGKLVENTPQSVVLDVGGIGYKIFVPMSSYSKLPTVGTYIQLFIYLAIRENEHLLYGFLKKEERELFLKLIEVNGIGPKTALSMLGHSDYLTLINSIQQANVTALCKVPGIGKKTAERLILEIKDKLQNQTLDLFKEEDKLSQDATSALTQLGYSVQIADKAVKNALKRASYEELSLLITEALKHCS
jgi:Holliday junction DNA helicase RuvA